MSLLFTFSCADPLSFWTGSKTAMAKIRKVAFRLIEPVMNRLVVLRPASESTCARFCVFDRVSHQYVSSPWEERSNTK